ncbi:MAG: hypothetical protein EOP05_12285 [Proteobacteria bacterium]|nr:MAG: hypothetical protein EOP05_12285 [Pseudomonadota bacterium]
MSELKLVNDKANSYWAIHDRAMMAASNLKRSEIEMLDALIDVESRQVYYQMEIKDLFQYCTEMLGLSRHASYNFITVMNKSKERRTPKNGLVSLENAHLESLSVQSQWQILELQFMSR